jgi:hypothetical protein
MAYLVATMLKCKTVNLKEQCRVWSSRKRVSTGIIGPILVSIRSAQQKSAHCHVYRVNLTGWYFMKIALCISKSSATARYRSKDQLLFSDRLWTYAARAQHSFYGGLPGMGSRPRPDKFEAKAREVRGQAEAKIDVTRPVSIKGIYTCCIIELGSRLGDRPIGRHFRTS